jgi:hypothetical protein
MVYELVSFGYSLATAAVWIVNLLYMGFPNQVYPRSLYADTDRRKRNTIYTVFNILR